MISTIPFPLSGLKIAYFKLSCLSNLICLWSVLSCLSSKVKRLQAQALMEFLIFCHLGKVCGRALCRSSWSQIDSAVAIICVSLGLVVKLCFSPNLRMDAFSVVSSSPVRLVIISLGLFLIPVFIACSRSRVLNLRS